MLNKPTVFEKQVNLICISIVVIFLMVCNLRVCNLLSQKMDCSIATLIVDGMKITAGWNILFQRTVLSASHAATLNVQETMERSNLGSLEICVSTYISAKLKKPTIHCSFQLKSTLEAVKL